MNGLSTMFYLFYSSFDYPKTPTFADARPIKQVQFFKGAVCKIRMHI